MKTLLERLAALGIGQGWATSVSERVDWLLESAKNVDGSHIVDTEDIVKRCVEALAENNALKEDNKILEDRLLAWKEEVDHLQDVIRELKKLKWKDGTDVTFTYVYPEGDDVEIRGIEKDYGAMEAMYLGKKDEVRALKLKIQTLETDREVLLLRLQRRCGSQSAISRWPGIPTRSGRSLRSIKPCVIHTFSKQIMIKGPTHGDVSPARMPSKYVPSQARLSEMYTRG